MYWHSAVTEPGCHLSIIETIYPWPWCGVTGHMHIIPFQHHTIIITRLDQYNYWRKQLNMVVTLLEKIFSGFLSIILMVSGGLEECKSILVWYEVTSSDWCNAGMNRTFVIFSVRVMRRVLAWLRRKKGQSAATIKHKISILVMLFYTYFFYYNTPWHNKFKLGPFPVLAYNIQIPISVGIFQAR